MSDQITQVILDKTGQYLQDLQKRESTSIFEETPVSLDEFLYGQAYLNFTKLSDKQYEFVKYGTQIYHEPNLIQLKWEVVRYVGELVAFWGKGSGKDLMSQIIQARIAYLLLCLNNPQRYFNQSDISSIDMLNMAYSSDQANSVFFKGFTALIESCSWFRDKCEIKNGMIQFDKRIAAYSGNSFEEAFEGKNLIIAILDEISAFKTKMEVARLSERRLRAPRYSAEAVYDMAKSSVESRFGRGIGKVISLSFSRFKNDFIQQLYELGKNEPTCYVSFGTTWDINPNKKKEDFDDEFRKNPDRAMSRYACNPTGVEGGFFKNRELLLRAFPLYGEERLPTTDEYVPKLKTNFKCPHSYPCSIHIDLGLKHDKAGICVSHVDSEREALVRDEQDLQTKTRLPVVKIDLITSFIATADVEINFGYIRQFVMDLINKGFIIGKLTLDSWNSVDFIQIMSGFGIEAEVRSVDRKTDAYDCLKELIYDGRLNGYSYLRTMAFAGTISKQNELLDELLQLIFDGRKVDHVAFSSKDVSDALAGSVQGAIEIGFAAFTINNIIEGRDKIEVLGSTYITDREFLRPPSDDYFSSM